MNTKRLGKSRKGREDLGEGVEKSHTHTHTQEKGYGAKDKQSYNTNRRLW